MTTKINYAVTPIYFHDDYIGERKKQSHFSYEKMKGINGFYYDDDKYQRCISSYFFEIDNYNGYTMYLPTMKLQSGSLILTIGEWNWNKKDMKWEFYRTPENNHHIRANWDNSKLNNLIENGTKILNSEGFIPDKTYW